ncbi:MAG: hypothetical protein U0T83_09405 [Bacteriovoracaceae bacterium]
MNGSNPIKAQKRVHGIYDLNTLNVLKKRDYFLFGFDFRPRSFNFLPQHNFLALLENSYSPIHKYYLHYANEPDFVTMKMVNDLHAFFDKKGETYDSIVLEFSDQRELSFYQSFKTPFVWHFHEDSKLARDILNDPLCVGAVIDLTYSKKLDNAEIHATINNLYRIWSKSKNVKEMTLILLFDWKMEINRHDFVTNEHLTISHPINSQVEICYRHVDLVTLNNHLLELRG